MEFHADAWRHQQIEICVFESCRIFRVCIYVALPYDSKETYLDVDEGCPSFIGEKECATDEYWHNRQSVLVMIIVANATSDTPLFADEPFVLVVHAKGIVSILACSFGDRCVDNIEASFFFIE